MKKLLALILTVLTLTAALCGCGDTAAPGTSDNDAPYPPRTRVRPPTRRSAPR